MVQMGIWGVAMSPWWNRSWATTPAMGARIRVRLFWVDGLGEAGGDLPDLGLGGVELGGRESSWERLAVPAFTRALTRVSWSRRASALALAASRPASAWFTASLWSSPRSTAMSWPAFTCCPCFTAMARMRSGTWAKTRTSLMPSSSPRTSTLWTRSWVPTLVISTARTGRASSPDLTLVLLQAASRGRGRG